MTSITHDHGAAQYGRATRGWSAQHPYVTTIAVMLAAIVCGVLVGILFNLVMSGAEPATIHRGGGSARAVAVRQAIQPAASEAQAAVGLTGFSFSWERSPARGGFAAGRSAPGDAQP